jgi:hypothetical protein
MDKREFWSTRNPGAVYETVTFDHPEFDAPFRLVANKFAEVTLGGNVYTPAPMTLKPPEQKGGARPKMTIAFPRQVVGRQFKQQLRLIAAAGSREPITVDYAVWLGETDAPKVTWPLYVSDEGGVNFTTKAVQVGATLDNPMKRFVALIYTPDVFTGLELV